MAYFLLLVAPAALGCHWVHARVLGSAAVYARSAGDAVNDWWRALSPSAPPPAQPNQARFAPERFAAGGAATKKSKAKPKAVFVSAASVLKLSQGARIPHGVFVPAAGARPAGLRLSGVSALGIGMRDGDVLTKVLGAEVASVADVVQRIIAARSRRAPQISGEFWRDGARWTLIVEQPYLDPPKSSGAEP